ncbi:MAG: hypothetical protein KBE30_06505, partial [Desulfobacter sp.]|nr:hypothetical protein [Desulfobacter sp.]
MKLHVSHFFTRLILIPALIMGLSFTIAAYSHAQNSRNNAAASIQLTPAEKTWLDRHPTITIAGPQSFPPFHYYEKDQLKGLSA